MQYSFRLGVLWSDRFSNCNNVFFSSFTANYNNRVWRNEMLMRKQEREAGEGASDHDQWDDHDVDDDDLDNDYDEDVDVDEAFLTINMMMTASEND